MQKWLEMVDLMMSYFETRGTWIKKKIILKLHMYKGNIVVMQSKYDAYFRWPY